MTDKTVTLRIQVNGQAVAPGARAASAEMNNLAGAAEQAGTRASRSLETINGRLAAITTNAAAVAPGVNAAATGVGGLGEAASRLAQQLAGASAAAEQLANFTREMTAASDASTAALQKQAQAAHTAQSAQIAALQGAGNYADENLAGMDLSKRASQDAAKRASDEAGASLRQLTAAYKQVTPEQEKANAAQLRGAKSAGEITQAYRQLPAQITDVVTGLVSGQPAYMVAIQQGGQLRDSFGSVGGVFKALGSILTPTRLLIGAAAAAAVLLGVAYSQGAHEGTEFQKSIILSGNAAGTTSGQLQMMASDIGKVTGSQHEAAGVLAELATSGKVANAQLQGAAQLAIQLEHSAGIAASTTVQAFIDLGTKPTAAIKTLNDQYHFLTAATYEQIRSLEEQGRTEEAAALAQATYASAMSGRSKQLTEQLGVIEQSAQGVEYAAKRMWNALLDVGRQQSPDQRLKEVEAQIQEIASSANLGNHGRFDQSALLKQLQAERQSLQKPVIADSQAAKAQADAAAAAQKGIDEQNRKAAEAVQARARDAANAEAVRSAAAASTLTDIQRDLSAETAAYSNQESVLEADRQAGLVSASEYYSKRVLLIQGAANAQVRALGAENDALRAQTASTVAEVAKAQAAVDALRSAGGPDYDAAVKRLDEASSKAVATKLQNDAKIKDNNAEAARVLDAQITQTQVLETTEHGRLAALAKGYAEAQAAADDYLATIARQYQLQEKDQFAGNQQRDFDSGEATIEEKYAQQRQELERAKNQALDTQADASRRQEIEDSYAKQLKITQDSLGKELALYRTHWQNLKAGEADWVNGAKEAFHNYYDEAMNTAKATETIFTDAFKSLEDALTDGLANSHFKFSQFIDQIKEDVLRLLLVKPLLADFASVFSGNGFAAAGKSGFGLSSVLGLFGNYIKTQTSTAAAAQAAAQTASTAASTTGAAAAAGSASPVTTGLSQMPGWVGLIVAGITANLNLQKAGWTVHGQQDDIFKSMQKNLGTFSQFVMPPLLLDKTLDNLGIGKTVANILSGSAVLAGVFGHKAPQITGQGITGDYGFEGIDAQSYVDIKAKGGLLRKDKKSTQYAELDGDIQDLFDSAAHQVRTNAEQLAKQAGVDISAQLAAVKVDTGKLQLSSDAEEAQQQLQQYVSDMVEKLSAETVKALGFGNLLDSGDDASEVMTALSASLQLVTGKADTLGRTLSALDITNVQKGVEYFQQLANDRGTSLPDEVERVTGLLNQYTDLIGGVNSDLLTQGLSDAQRSALEIETTYRQQVQQANQLAQALGLTGARTEDLTQIEQLRAARLADLTQQIKDQAASIVNGLSTSDLSPLKDSQKLSASMDQLRAAIAKGDVSSAAQLAQSTLSLGRNLYASGEDFNTLYDTVTALLQQMGLPSLDEADGTTMGDLADILLDLPQKIGSAVFDAMINPQVPAPSTPPVVTAQSVPPTPATSAGFDNLSGLLQEILATLKQQTKQQGIAGLTTALQGR